ncbi:histidine kinase [Kitasatospora sp. NPDC049285]|uniref:sensor histidine kinase n=1 Tax=Kitasatospora sp. NPDC049285 TaxID=3157096 RepID=UPI003415B50B
MHPTPAAPGPAVRLGPAGRERLADTVPAVALLAAMLVERFGAAERIGARMPAALALTAVLTAAVALRRRAPLAAYLVGTAALAAESLAVLPSPVSPYANLLGAYALGRYAGRGRALFGPPIVVAGMAGYFTGAQEAAPVLPIGVLTVWLAAWAFGYATAHRLAAQAAERSRARRLLLAEERTRIAREVHDLLGHSLTLMLVQAGAARRVLDRTPERGRELLGELERTGQDALGELDRVLGLLRGSDGGGDSGTASGTASGDDTAAEPGLAELPRLAGRMAQAGLEVTVRHTAELPADLDRCAYRIVQEALTNTLRHSGAARAAVSIGRAGAAAVVEVRDDGAGPPDGYRPGRGLRGIAERAARFGGAVDHGAGGHLPGEHGGFRLRVTFPLGKG